MGRFEAQFEAYGGDYQMTMSRFLGSESMYLRILQMLFQDENMEKLKNALARGDLSSAFEAAHTLKGVAGNLGLIPLYHAICSMVEPLRQKQQIDYSQGYRLLVQEFERVRQLNECLQGTQE